MDVLVNNEIVLYGTVGDDFFGEGFTAVDVLKALPRVQGDLVVRINSGGGIVDDGVAIYNAIKLRAGKKTVYIDGVAASAASLIAMAGDEIIMRLGSTMMIHDPSTIAFGNAAEMKKIVEALDVTAKAMAEIYAAKTGRDMDTIRAEMREEIWLTADQAIAKGYATSKDVAVAVEAMAFDYRTYLRAPEEIVALSDQRAWSNRLKGQAPLPQHKRTAMTTPNPPAPAPTPAPVDTAAIIKAEQDRVTGILALCDENKVQAMASALIRDGVTLEAASTRIKAEGERAAKIKAKVEQARKVCPSIAANLADEFIAGGHSLEAVGDDLLDRISRVSAVNSQRPQHTGGNGGSGSTTDSDTKAMTSRVVAKINKQRGL